MGIKAIIETKNTILKRCRPFGNSAYVPLPKELDGEEVSLIPVNISVDKYLDKMLKQDRFILNDPIIMKRTVKKLRKYVYGVYLPKEYGHQMMIIVLK